MTIEWIKTPGLMHYDAAIQEMEARVAAIRQGSAGEAVWLLQHPSLYTAGTSAKAQDLLQAQFPVHQTGRGGQYTYHGPGQRIAYVMLDLAKRGGDVRQFVWQLEEWVIRTLAVFGVTGLRRAGRIGIWVVMPDATEAKIAALGVRVRHGVTYHGLAVNVDPELSHFAGIIPCGLAGYGVTSLAQLGRTSTLAELDQALQQEFSGVFSQPAL